MNKPNPKVGQILYSLNIGNAARRCEQKLTPVVVITVGRKYFTVSEEQYRGSPHMHVTHHLGTWREKTEFCENSSLYETRQKREDEKEEASICRAIYTVFEYGRNKHNISLDVLREIAARLP